MRNREIELQTHEHTPILKTIYYICAVLAFSNDIYTYIRGVPILSYHQRRRIEKKTAKKKKETDSGSFFPL